MNKKSTALLNIKSIKDLEKTKFNYKQRIENEKRFYSSIERTESGSEKVNTALQFTLSTFQNMIEARIDHNVWNYAINAVNTRKFTKFLSLGTGMCNLEVTLAGKFTCPYELSCLEFNQDIMTRGLELASKHGVNIIPLVQDINYLKLDKMYDIIFVHAALHHFVELEHILSVCRSHLSSDGEFIVYDITARNGLLLWPEQRKMMLFFRYYPKNTVITMISAK